MSETLVPDPRRWRALALVCVAFFMVVLDVSIVNVALPSIATDLDLSQSTLQWIVTGYSLAFGGFLLLGGRAADVFGRRKVFMLGMGLFTFASLMCGFAQSDQGACKLAEGAQCRVQGEPEVDGLLPRGAPVREM